MTVAVTLFALLELYKRGEAWWEQGSPSARSPCMRRPHTREPRFRGHAGERGRASSPTRARAGAAGARIGASDVERLCL